jgi:hypothetical protein
VGGKVSGEKIVLSWSAETAEGFQGYKVVASKTNPNPKYPDDGYLKYITERDKTSVSLSAGSCGLKGGTEYYFSVTYMFADGSAIAGSAVKLKVPKASGPDPTECPTECPTEAPTECPTECPTDNPADCPTECPTEQPGGDYASSSIHCSIDGAKVRLSWSKIEDPRFSGYKVVYSTSNPSPKYPNDCYKYYITNAGDTGCSFDASEIGCPGTVCYFSITVLYDGGNVKVPGNAISLTMPAGEAPTECPPPECPTDAAAPTECPPPECPTDPAAPAECPPAA